MSNRYIGTEGRNVQAQKQMLLAEYYRTSRKSRQSRDFQPYISRDTSTVKISRYEEKSVIVSLYDCNFEFPAKQDIFFENQRIVSPSKYNTRTDAI